MVISIFIAFVVAASLTRLFCLPNSLLYILDYPNERSLHTQPVPRSGGIAILGGLLAGGGAMYFIADSLGRDLVMLFAGMLPVAMISFWDDRFGTHPTVRIVVHGLASVLWLQSGYIPDFLELPGLYWSPPLFLKIPFLLLFMVWMINLYNFMDGMDGFAGGMTVIGFTTYAILGGQAGHFLFMGICLFIVGATLGFLLFNLPPARIFMGDTGSSTLGFLAAALSLWASHDGLFPLWLAVLIFSPFVVDASVTLVQRLLRGEKIWQPHRSHYYQRLVRMGWGHSKTLWVEYALMLGCSVSAVWILQSSVTTQITMLTAWVVLYSLLMVGVGRLERHSTEATG